MNVNAIILVSVSFDFMISDRDILYLNTHAGM